MPKNHNRNDLSQVITSLPFRPMVMAANEPNGGLCKAPVAALCECRGDMKSLENHGALADIGGHRPPLQQKLCLAEVSSGLYCGNAERRENHAPGVLFTSREGSKLLIHCHWEIALALAMLE